MDKPKRKAPPVITQTNCTFALSAFQTALREVVEACAPVYEQLARNIAELLKSPKQRAEDFADSLQCELRTPPSEWPCLPSPRVCGLDRETW